MFDNGAEIILVDFHMHTHRDKEFSFDGEDNTLERFFDTLTQHRTESHETAGELR